MVTDTREIELKYEAGPDTVLPPLEDLPQVASEAGPAEQKLEAEYYDTEDLRLLRAGVTLRGRRPGRERGGRPRRRGGGRRGGGGWPAGGGRGGRRPPRGLAGAGQGVQP